MTVNARAHVCASEREKTRVRGTADLDPGGGVDGIFLFFHAKRESTSPEMDPDFFRSGDADLLAAEC